MMPKRAGVLFNLLANFWLTLDGEVSVSAPYVLVGMLRKLIFDTYVCVAQIKGKSKNRSGETSELVNKKSPVMRWENWFGFIAIYYTLHIPFQYVQHDRVH